MLKNYFKIAIAVLMRRKFFTFISLFGISFTLTVLMVFTALLDNLFSAGYPDMKRDRSLYISRVELRNSKENWISISNSSFYFLNHYAGSMKTPAKIALSTNSNSSNAYVNNKKIVIGIKYTNADFWDVADFDFLEGKPYTKQQIEQAQRVAVICESTKKDYFGDVTGVVGKYIEADNLQYRVIGVVKDAPVVSEAFCANMYLPYTVSKGDYKEITEQGPYSAVLLAANKADLPKIQEEYNQVIKRISRKNMEYDKLYSYADPFFTSVARNMFGREETSGMTKVIVGATLIILLFMLLPTINLVNINITRIMERSSEIGVRKAFGASSRTLVYQFIVENIILTVIGGIIGILFSYIILQIINGSNLIQGMQLSLNLKVLFYSLLTCLFFGLVSGVYPAWRMSKLNVVTALKAQ